MDKLDFDNLLQAAIDRKKQLQVLKRKHLEIKQTIEKTESEVNVLQSDAETKKSEQVSLSGFGFASFFYAITGRRKQRLEEVSKAFQRSQAKYEARRYLLDNTLKELNKLEESIEDLGNPTEDYNQTLQAKKRYFEQQQTSSAKAWQALEEQEASIEHQIKTSEQAIKIGDDMVDLLEVTMNILANPTALESWDVVNAGMLGSGNRMMIFNQLQKLTARIRELSIEYLEIMDDLEPKTDLETPAREDLKNLTLGKVINSGWTTPSQIKAQLEYAIGLQQSVDEQNGAFEALKGGLRTEISTLGKKIERLILKAKE